MDNNINSTTKFRYGFGLLVDEFGNPVSKLPQDYPYSYDGFVVQRLGKNEQITDTSYSDRLRQEDREKSDRLSLKYFGEKGDCWSGRDSSQIELFLREFLNKPKLKLILVMQYCHQSSGNPYWRFDFNRGE